MKYSVIAPVFNEEGNVRELVEQIGSAMKGAGLDFETLIVDDGSSDATLQNLIELTEKHPELKVVSLAQNCGQTVAFQAGFDHASGKRVVTIDGDLEKNPSYIPVMIKKMDDEKLDLVYFRKLYQKDISFKRRFASKIANSFRNCITGDTAVDVGSTFKVYRRNLFKGRNFSSGFHRYFIGIMEVEGLTMGYIEGPVGNRPHGETKYTNWGRMKQGLSDLFYFYLYKNRKIGFHKLIFLALGLFVLTLFVPAPELLKKAIYTTLATFTAITISLVIHTQSLLVQSKRLPYKVRGTWPNE